MSLLEGEITVDKCLTALDCEEAISRRAYHGWNLLGNIDRWIKEDEDTGRIVGWYYKLIFIRRV